MSDLVLYLTLCVSLLIVVLLFLTLWRGQTRKEGVDVDDEQQMLERRRRLLRPTDAQNDGPRRRVRHNRVPLNANQADDDEDEADDDQQDFDELPVDTKIGAKKRKKLEMKAEKRNQRERELQEREEKKERQKQLDEMRAKEEEKQKEEERQRVGIS